ncbi:MAG: SDR family NAD(P)-dependent oxidoreductase [Coriobacteriales bacterium]|jgi:NAD(P)-dependent dehydrogenase (short-subunit alcohol dehydrogenase family)/acyl carrier protein|nr:SDR family NAD(P)-dependent oxidoreductase [Coriobacteriales bacterium]
MLGNDEPENNHAKTASKKGKLLSRMGVLDDGTSLPPAEFKLKPEYANASLEQIMMTYLSNTGDLAQDQRDVMLGYLGQDSVIPRAPRPVRSFTVSSTATLPADTPLDVTPVAAVEEQEEADTEDGIPSILDLSTKEITNIILDVVSEKTGYPVDMLDFDANLEADLSIDSIKKMEIVGGLRERASFPENDDDDMDASFEKLISIKTLQEMLDWIESLAETGKTESSAAGGSSSFDGASITAEAHALIGTGTDASTDEAADEATGEMRINRLILRESAAPSLKPEEGILEGKAFAVTDDGSGRAAALVEALAQRGATATLVTAGTDDLSAFDGLILINASASKTHYTTIDFFNLLKRADWEKLTWIYTFDDSVGELFATGDLSRVDLLEGFTGLIKTLKHEHADKRLCAVTFHTPIEPESFVARATDELLEAEPFPEVFYRGETRFFMLPVLEELDALGDSSADGGLELDAGSHILVLGGAQGITAPLVSRFAERYPCHYILVGRSAASLDNEDYAQLGSIDEIRSYLIKTEGMKQPREVEHKARGIFKTNQIRQAIERIEATGATASYRNVDVRDDAALRGLIGKLRKEYGTIDGVIHAAGILEDKLFRDKEVESFARVHGTKVDPLRTVLTELADEIRLLVMFSSVTSTFGNIGQCDYASGNSVMDNVARVLAHHRPKIRTVAFNWGPWKGAGMVNTGLEQEFRRRGVAFLELEEGGSFFVNELVHGNEHGVIAIAGTTQAVNQFFAALPREEA